MITARPFLRLVLPLLTLLPQPYQPWQTPSGSDCQSVQKHVKKEYDRFKDTTTVRLDELVLSDRPLSGEKLTLRVEATYAGDKGSKPKDVKLVFSSQAARLRLYQGQEAIFLADCERIKSVSAVDGLPDLYGTTTRFERKDVTVRYEDFVKIANAQTVEMQLGAAEAKFDKKVLRVLRDFVACAFES